MNRSFFCGRAGLLCISIFLLGVGSSHSAEIRETYHSAYGSFLQGDYDAAASGYRYLDTIGVDGAVPVINLALLARDEGKPDEALAYWTKAALLAPKDAFVWNQRGWCYLSMGRLRDARNSFHQAAAVSSLSTWSSEADFGLGMTEMYDSNYKAALDALNSAVLPSPYLLSGITSMLAESSVSVRRWADAEKFLKQSLLDDPLQPDILRRLAMVYEKTDDPRESWLALKALLDFLPDDLQAQQDLAHEANFIPEKPERLLSVTRSARPRIQKPEPLAVVDKNETVRVGLYSNSIGEPGTITHFFFISGSDFKIIHPELGEVNRGLANEQWEVTASRETGVIELRDVHGRIQYTTKQSFSIVPSSAGASVLIKDPELTDIRGVDMGDKEVRGKVEAIPNVYGIQLVNEVGVEDYLLSHVAAVMPAGAAPESLKAEAILQRTRLEWMRRSARPAGLLRLHTCDSAHCDPYPGVGAERDDVTKAVLETAGAKLYREQELYVAGRQTYCSGSTEEGASDLPPTDRPIGSVFELELHSHSFPEKDMYDELAALTKPTWSRWIRVLGADDLRQNLQSEKALGRLTGVFVLRRSPEGRVEALRVVGSLREATVEGFPAIEAFLSPGGLRSNFFTLQPIYDGHLLSRLLVWGMGTGDGRGLCLAGSMGLAAEGKNAREILTHYFPGSRLVGWVPSGLRSSAASPSGRASRTKVVSVSTASVAPASHISAKKALSRRQLRAKLKAQAKLGLSPLGAASASPEAPAAVSSPASAAIAHAQ